MKVSWTTGLEPDMIAEMKMAFKSSTILRRRLAVMLHDKEQDNYKSNISKSDYDSPNWSVKKADSIGYARALSDIIKLIQ